MYAQWPLDGDAHLVLFLSYRITVTLSLALDTKPFNSMTLEDLYHIDLAPAWKCQQKQIFPKKVPCIYLFLSHTSSYIYSICITDQLAVTR